MTMTDEQLMEGFLNASLPTDAFHHEQHLRVAWLFVTRDGMPAALGTFLEALRHFATVKGATTLYHATITWAFLLLIHERQMRDAAPDWATFSAGNADLFAWTPSILDRLYRPETLASAFAKHTFVLPDRTSA
ncbi:MAG TPA: hypothetical protein VNJ02_06710 [Vicinamibacterales bacterium]|nr:hypothetical protein [Vicinamibacterales bacterium]